MHPLSNFIAEQYSAVQSARNALFDYCKTVSQADFINENNSFGRGGSMRNLLVHIANVYEFWIGQNALKKKITFTNHGSKNDIEQTISLFDEVDGLVLEFMDIFKLADIKPIAYELNNQHNNVTAIKLFTHVITHEFHHKGQILSISRHLGYTPVDTDIIR